MIGKNALVGNYLFAFAYVDTDAELMNIPPSLNAYVVSPTATRVGSK
jgi:hypothetical protein